MVVQSMDNNVTRAKSKDSEELPNKMLTAAKRRLALFTAWCRLGQHLQTKSLCESHTAKARRIQKRPQVLHHFAPGSNQRHRFNVRHYSFREVQSTRPEEASN